jgi:hypothetical protein
MHHKLSSTGVKSQLHPYTHLARFAPGLGVKKPEIDMLFDGIERALDDTIPMAKAA